jgi:hypothetical protein
MIPHHPQSTFLHHKSNNIHLYHMGYCFEHTDHNMSQPV